MQIKIRDKVRDTVTGFEGIVVSRTEWLNGCVRLGVQPLALKDGLPQEVQHLDEAQLEIIQLADSPRGPNPNDRPPGGPRQDDRGMR